MFAELVDKYTPFLHWYLAESFHQRSKGDREEMLHETWIDVGQALANNPKFAPDHKWETWLGVVARHAALRWLRRQERRWLQMIADKSADPALAAEMPSPSAIVAEIERRDRQTLLLSDILREYVARCEQKQMQTQKEIYERRLRGQEPTQIASEMGVSEDNVYQHLKRARDWIMERIQQADVARSVFQTFLRPRRETPVTSGLPDHVPRNFHEVLQRVVHEAGVLCPSDGRLMLYLASPSEVELRDVRYHVEDAGCPLCAAQM